MTTISLRGYNREVETMIEQGQTEAAIVHGRHILQYFPKHIDTYRLLGKAYLESLRFGDAADIFQRVLSSMPDDFVSHVGMSIIREDEANLDAAIWHMEIAYDIQPSNIAIQDELHRLYERRDEVDHPKIRLTRGALARMYAHSNIYEQSIAELRAALSEGTQRLDLQVLLAQMYDKNGQKVEAAKRCSQLIKKLPYCFEANRILNEFLKDTDREVEAKTYHKRVTELDPYWAYISSKEPTTDSVHDSMVTFPILDWESGKQTVTTPSRPEWADSERNGSSSFASAKEDTVTDAGQAEIPLSKSDEPVNEDMKMRKDQNLDWINNDNSDPEENNAEKEPRREISSEREGIDEEGKQDITPDDIPDWLRALAPEDLEEQAPTAAKSTVPDESPSPEDIEIPNWIQNLVDEETSDAAGPTETVADETPTTDTVPDWLKELDSEVGADIDTGVSKVTQAAEELSSADSDIPEWLQEIDTEFSADVPEAPQPKFEPPSAEPSEIFSGEETTDWLADFEEFSTSSPQSAESLKETTQPSEEIPDFFEDVGEGESTLESQTETAESTLPDSIGQDEEAITTDSIDIPDWLKGLGDDFLPQEETAPTASVEDLAEGEISIETLSSPPGLDEPSELEGEPVGISKEEPDAAVAWLESLAAREGVKEEELFTSPEERIDVPPDWVQTMIQERQSPTAEADLLPVASERASDPIEEAPEWIPIEVDEETPAKELAEISSLIDKDKEPDLSWLEDLGAKELAQEEVVPIQHEESGETLTEWQQEIAIEETEQPVEESPFATAADQIEEAEIEIPKLQLTPEIWAEPEIADVAASDSVGDVVAEAEPEVLAEVEPQVEEEVAEAEILAEVDVKLEKDIAAEVEAEVTLEEDTLVEPDIAIEAEVPTVAETLLEQKTPVDTPEIELEQPAEPILATVPEEVVDETLEIKAQPPDSKDIGDNLTQARNELSEGQIATSAESYSHLIKEGKNLDVVIEDLKEAIDSQYPTDTSIWQALGDAYLRDDQLEKALDAYSKAEEFLV